MSGQIELSSVRDTYGWSDAGVSHTSTGHASPAASIAAPPASSWRTAATCPRGAVHRYAAAIAGTTMSACDTRTDSEDSPKARAERACTMSASGGLSTGGVR